MSLQHVWEVPGGSQELICGRNMVAWIGGGTGGQAGGGPAFVAALAGCCNRSKKVLGRPNSAQGGLRGLLPCGTHTLADRHRHWAAAGGGEGASRTRQSLRSSHSPGASKMQMSSVDGAEEAAWPLLCCWQVRRLGP